MDVKCPRCGSDFKKDELFLVYYVKCQKCGLFTWLKHDANLDSEGEFGFYYGMSGYATACCCKDCENLNLESCVGVCKVDSEIQQEGLK